MINSHFHSYGLLFLLGAGFLTVKLVVGSSNEMRIATQLLRRTLEARNAGREGDASSLTTMHSFVSANQPLKEEEETSGSVCLVNAVVDSENGYIPGAMQVQG